MQTMMKLFGKDFMTITNDDTLDALEKKQIDYMVK